MNNWTLASHVRRATGHVRRVTCDVLRATCYVLGATSYVLGATSHVDPGMSHAARSTQHGASGTSPVARSTQHVARGSSPVARGTSHVARLQDARQIVDEAQKRGRSDSQRYEGILQTFEAQGKTSEKRWIYERIGSHGQSKVIIRFSAPPEVRGVALLIVNHPDRASDQWMWTPALERDRRIALQDRSTRFFGTDFSFEDLEERDVFQYEYTLLGEETVDGALCWKIQSTPRQSRVSQYTRSIIWIRKDTYAWARIDSYVKDAVVRRLDYRDITNVQGIWTARETVMTDLRRGSITRLALEKIDYNVPLRDGDFTVEALRRK